MNRRHLLAAFTAAAAAPFFGSFRSVRVRAATPRDLDFRALHRGSQVGSHRIGFRSEDDRLTVTTDIDITIKVLFFTAFHVTHHAEEVWRGSRLVSVSSTTDDNGTSLRVSGYAADDGFRILGQDGPFLATANLLTSNTMWDPRLIRESKLIDVQHGAEVGMVSKQLGDEDVTTPQGVVRANRYQIITPHNAGSLFYDADGRWVKGLIEQQGEIVEYALAT
jgi:hypothetical protein